MAEQDAVIDAAGRLSDEARRLGVDVLYSEKGHFIAAGHWRKVNYFLGIPAAILGVISGATILGDGSSAVAGWAALGSAVLTALNTFLNPSERAAQHQKVGTQYGTTRRLIRQLVQIDAVVGGDAGPLRQQLDELTSKVGDIQGEALPIPGLAYWCAVRSIRRGTADYTPDELNAATGALPLA